VCKIEQLEDGDILIKIPMSLRTFSGRKQVITPGAVDCTARNTTDNVILLAIARAHHWQKMIDDGLFKSGTAIARELGVDVSYITRILRLNLLSPRIVRLFLTGMAPDKLSLKQLTQALPDVWEEQEKMFLG